MGKRPSQESIVLLSMRQLTGSAMAPSLPPEALQASRSIAHWIMTYLMQPHPDLGRTGEVCPFTSRAHELDTIRIGVSLAASGDSAAVERSMRECLRSFSAIPCEPAKRHLRTILVGYPNLNDEDGASVLRAAQRRLKWHCLWKGLMIGRFHPGSEDEGLWNADFRPMRSPIPLLAIRHMVRNDAPFALRNPLLLVGYACRYAMAAPKHLLTNLARRRERGAARF
jgi:hypothetical protein